MRRNSGPESSCRKTCSLLEGKLIDKDSEKTIQPSMQTNKKHNDESFKHDGKHKSRFKTNVRRDDSTSSDDDSNFNRRGQSLDRSLYKQQKQTLCFQRDKDTTQLSNRRLEKMGHRKDMSSNESLLSKGAKSPHRSTEYLDQMDTLGKGSSSDELKRVTRKKESKSPSQQSLPLDEQQFATLNRDSSIPFNSSNEMQTDRQKSKENSKFQIGKRFLKGEIGIKSFNYYLLKEGLKSTTKKSKQRSASSDQHLMISKSDENIYEELYFAENKRSLYKNSLNYDDCELCKQECKNKNCDICKANKAKSKNHSKTKTLPAKFRSNSSGKPRFALVDHSNANKIRSSSSTENFTDMWLEGSTNILHFQSYNPLTGIYKLETTPVAFANEYIPAVRQQQPKLIQKQVFHRPATQKISSSSSDSLQHQQKYSLTAAKSNDSQSNAEISFSQQNNQLRPQIYKTDSRASILSEMSTKSENSANRSYTKPIAAAEMSDSSIGDSLFSYPAQRRYFGSAESCKFGYECRRCSYDGEKCSFSDNCRYECRNCDCSSSYFSSDFDDGNFSRRGSARILNANPITYYDDTHKIDASKIQYAEDYLKNVNNVKKTYSSYQTMPVLYNQNERGPKSKPMVLTKEVKTEVHLNILL